MKENLHEIRIGQGLGNLRFGISRDEVKKMLGEPTDKEVYDLTDDPDFEDDETEAWHYDDRGISVSFDQINDWKLTSIVVGSPEFTLDGQTLVGRSKDEVLEVFSKGPWGEIEEDEEIGGDQSGDSLVYVEGASLSLFFESNTLSEIQWGPTVKDGQIIWPGA